MRASDIELIEGSEEYFTLRKTYLSCEFDGKCACRVLEYLQVCLETNYPLIFEINCKKV